MDLLAEKQLRRIHQTTLNKFDPKNVDYDTTSLLNDESITKRHEASIVPEDGNKNYTITPFWRLSCEANATKKEPPKDKSKPYVIPSKIQKADTKSPPQRPRYWHEPKLRHQCNRLSSFTLKDLTDSKANLSQSPHLRHKLPSSSSSSSVIFNNETRDNHLPSTSSQQTAFRFGGSDQQLPSNRSLFSFGDPAKATSSSASISFNFKTENSNAQDGFKLLNSQNESNKTTTTTHHQEPSTSSAAESSSKKFTFGPKASDR